MIDVLAATATVMLTGEGIWMLSRMKDPARKEEEKEVNLQHKKICVVFPCYKDIVDISKWLAWADASVEFLIIEDIHNGNLSSDERVTVLQRNNRNGFKAGALNAALEYLVSSKKQSFDYVLFFDADHIPQASLSQITLGLRSSVVQFFWDDGEPLHGAIDWLIYSSRYYSNWNIFNRNFRNLTGSAMAIRYDMILQGLRFPDSITEDYALSLALLKAGIAIDVVPLTISIGKSPRNFDAFIRQQNRWAEGTIRDALDNCSALKEMEWSARMDFLLHVNMYAQGVWIIAATMGLFLLGINIDLIAIGLMAVQLVSYFATLRKAPKKYWPLYFLLNYVMVPFQTYALIKAFVKASGRFYRTQKNGD